MGGECGIGTGTGGEIFREKLILSPGLLSKGLQEEGICCPVK